MSIKTYGEAEREGRKRLEEAGVPDAFFDARALLLDICGVDAARWPLLINDPISDDCYETFRNYTERRAGREPLQHILGSAPFYGREFHVDGRVLIPRFDTETLVSAVLPHLESGTRIWDLCTGSGCILLTLLLEGPCGMEGVGTDISRDALKVAEKNRKRYEKDIGLKKSEAVFFQGNLYETSRAAHACDKMEFDVIVSNPPYIRTSEIEQLMPEVKDYDPVIALDGGEDGLDFLQKIVSGAADWLKEGGLLALECGYDQTEALADLMERAGYGGIRIFRDEGGNPRCVLGNLTECETGDKTR